MSAQATERIRSILSSCQSNHASISAPCVSTPERGSDACPSDGGSLTQRFARYSTNRIDIKLTAPVTKASLGADETSSDHSSTELPTGDRAIPRRSRRRGSLDSACIRFSAGPMRPRGAETIGAAFEVRYSWEQSVSRLWTGGATPKSNSGEPAE